MENRVLKNSKYHLNMVKTLKFKTTRMQISFAGDFLEQTVTKRSLLPYLLNSISEKYPTRESMSIYLEDMYAANFNVGISKIGLTHFLSFDLSFINDDFTFENESLFERAVSFLHEVLFNPKFDQQILEEETRLLKEFYEASYANKMKYTIQKHHEVMFSEELYRINPLGRASDLTNISLSDMIQTYHQMMQNDLIVITIVGDIDFDMTEKLISETFDFTEREYLPILLDTKMKHIKEVTKAIEEIDVNQAKLVVGYRGLPHYLGDDYYPAIVFNNIFGASSESLLFKEVREEKGLVYFISSSYDPYKGVMFVTSGINEDDYEQVVLTIDEVLTKIINKEVSNQLLEVSKNIVVNHLIESLDSAHSLMTRFQRNSLFGIDFDIEQMIEIIQQVTISEVAEIAKNLKKDTIYLLRGEQHD
ncbi:MAG: insulinase family protein [Firmicutes bacterium]|nr:insulinase family protein [Bacillota bacterium]